MDISTQVHHTHSELVGRGWGRLGEGGWRWGSGGRGSPHHCSWMNLGSWMNKDIASDPGFTLWVDCQPLWVSSLVDGQVMPIGINGSPVSWQQNAFNRNNTSIETNQKKNKQKNREITPPPPPTKKPNQTKHTHTHTNTHKTVVKHWWVNAILLSHQRKLWHRHSRYDKETTFISCMDGTTALNTSTQITTWSLHHFCIHIRWKLS